MRRERVKSTSIRSMGYEGKTLEVEFHNGSLFQYFDVPSATVENMKKARSVGQYFGTHVRERFRSARVERSQR